MKVFVLTSAFDYEGESPVGVFASQHLAMTEAKRIAVERGYDSGTWAEVAGRLELQCGSNQWVIREEEVRGGRYTGEMDIPLQHNGVRIA